MANIPSPRRVTKSLGRAAVLALAGIGGDSLAVHGRCEVPAARQPSDFGP